MHEEPYNETVAGFKKKLAANRNLQFTELSLSQVSRLNQTQLTGLDPDLIFALGHEAAKWASHDISGIPVIATLDFNDGSLANSQNVTGVRMHHSLQTQLLWLKKIFKRVNKIGVIYHPGDMGYSPEKAEQISRQLHIGLESIPIGSPRELPEALEKVRQEAQVLLAIPDKTVYTENSMNEIYMFSFASKLPLIGLADNWTRSGAVYSLSWDFVDLGRQCAELASRMLNGTPVRAIRPEYPRRVAYTINSKIAKRMQIDIPPSVLANAKLIF